MKKETSRYFVATTALEEFWDTSLPVVFLGEWCKRYSLKSRWEQLESTTLQSAIPENELFEVIKSLEGIYERLLPVLAQTFNDIHGVSFSTRYWRIVIGPWLLFYLHTVHDKYTQINILKQKSPDFTTICLDESSFVTPDDTLTFANLMTWDAYNLQLYSQLFHILGYKFPTKKIAVKLDLEVKRTNFVRPKTMGNRIIWLLIDLIDRVSVKRRKIVFESVYFPKAALIKLMLKMKGNFWPYVGSDKLRGNLPCNKDVRKEIASIKFGDNEFERMLLPLISTGLPKSMLEGFLSNKVNISRKCIYPPKAIMSAIGWYFNEEFKMYAAQCADNGTALFGVQHGVGYGMLKYLFLEEYELSITDKYFSWGWTRNDCHAKVEPLPATKLVKERSRKRSQGSNDILYVTDFFNRFMMIYPLRADLWKDYFDRQSVFLSHLSQRVKEHLVIRPSREDGGMDFNERFRGVISDVRIETWAKPFYEREYSILVCDNPCYSTPFIESLVNNRPTILFTNPHFVANYTNQRAKPYWDRLKEIGLLYDDPVEASKKIDEIYGNINNWWHEPKRQEGVRFFLSEFGRVSDQWEKEWVEVLERTLV